MALELLEERRLLNGDPLPWQFDPPSDLTEPSAGGWTAGAGGAAATAGYDDQLRQLETASLTNLPDLVPYQAPGWSDPIVISTSRGDAVDAQVLTIGDNLFFDFAWHNVGMIASGPFMVQVALEGGSEWDVQASSLEPGPSYSGFADIEFTPEFLSAGLHTVTIRVDSDEDVIESDETNNVYQRQFQIGLPAHPQQIEVPTADILTADASTWLTMPGTISDDLRVTYRLTLAAAAGLFVDLDSRASGLSSTLDAAIAVFDAVGNVLGINDDGFDFQGFPAPAEAVVSAWEAGFVDPALYLDLPAGDYYLIVRGLAETSGDYQLRLLSDPNYAASVPPLDSLPGAADSLYLDFDGHAAADDAWPTYSAAAFGFDGDPARFSPGERLAIQNAWRIVAEDYSPFQINVTTADPGAFGDGQAYRMIVTASDATIVGQPLDVLGLAYRHSYSQLGADDNVGFVFAGSFSDYDAGPSGRIMAAALETGNTISHEFGHALGLTHFASYAGSAGAAQTIPEAIMATPEIGLNRALWSVGTSQDASLQNDMAVISGAANTFGVRVDDHGDAAAAATELTPWGATYSAAGVISPLSDADWFRFTASGQTEIRVDVDDYENNLNAKLQLYASDGTTLLQTHDPSDSFDAWITGNLAAGVYYLAVSSGGQTGEVGQYRLSIAGEAARIVGRHVFYNGSYFDGGRAAAEAADDGAIATDKAALLPGQTATFANYTSYSRGINGIMIDIAGARDAASLTAASFEFRVGNTSSPAGWGNAPESPSISVRAGAGAGGSHRVTLIWPDNTIRNQWLQVVVRADAVTGLAAPDVFYFGNAVADSGNSTGNTFVDGTDFAGARDNPRSMADRAPVDFRFDFDRNSFVDATDLALARDNNSNFLNALRLITAPAALPAVPAPSPLLTAAALGGEGEGMGFPDVTWTSGPSSEFHSAMSTAGGQVEASLPGAGSRLGETERGRTVPAEGRIRGLGPTRGRMVDDYLGQLGHADPRSAAWEEALDDIAREILLLRPESLT